MHPAAASQRLLGLSHTKSVSVAATGPANAQATTAVQAGALLERQRQPAAMRLRGHALAPVRRPGRRVRVAGRHSRAQELSVRPEAGERRGGLRCSDRFGLHRWQGARPRRLVASCTSHSSSAY